ncbi:MAG: enoyl-CoA hydratase/isomerase family protein, partial [Proteobacteria bacterium]
GYALGGGCGIALACTVRVMSTDARIGLPEVKLGVLPGGGGTQRLPRIVGLGWALHIALTAEFLDAETAFRIGLVTKLAKPEELMEACTEIATKLAEKPPLAVRAIEQAMRASFDVNSHRGLEMERQLMATLLSTEDHHEGIRAFLEKRKANFKGK